MVVPVRFPHNLYILAPEGGSIDGNGDIDPGTDIWINVTECREEKKSGSFKSVADGKVFEFTSMIYTPAGFNGVKEGDTFQVRQGSSVRASGTVKLFDQGANHSRIWV